MPDPRGAIVEVLDRMVNLGWATGYVRNSKDQFVVDWTNEGGRKIAQLSSNASELGILTIGPDDEILWWAVLVLAIQNIPL